MKFKKTPTVFALGFYIIAIVASGLVIADEPWQSLSDQEIESHQWQQPSQMLKEFIDQLESPYTAFGSGGAMLDDKEIQDAIEILRARYPLVSIRDRIQRLQKSHGKKSEVPTSVSRHSEQVESRNDRTEMSGWATLRRDSLHALHSEHVKDFIASPGNGFGRFPVVGPSQLPLFESKFAGFDNASVSSDVLNESIVLKQSFALSEHKRAPLVFGSEVLPNRIKLQKFAHNLYSSTVFPFASPTSTGYFRSMDEVAGFEAHQLRMPQGWKPIFAEGRWLDETLNHDLQEAAQQEVQWRVNRVQLVSLLLHQQPSVYLTDQPPNMEQLSSANAPVRAVDRFESTALANLQADADVVLQASANRIRMLGSVRCTESCINCHTTAKKGDLLGAFSYEILRSPPKVQRDQAPVH